jgi:hypothetical protein
VAEPLVRVELAASFLERLAAIETFLAETAAGFACDKLLDELRATVTPNLRRFPRIGRRYLDRYRSRREALAQLAARRDLPAAIRTAPGRSTGSPSESRGRGPLTDGTRRRSADPMT